MVTLAGWYIHTSLFRKLWKVRVDSRTKVAGRFLGSCLWIGILSSPLRQAAVHAAASEWIVLPIPAPGTLVELAKELIAAAWAAKVRLLVADGGPREHPHESGQKDRGAVAVAHPAKYAAHIGQAREEGHKSNPERPAPEPVQQWRHAARIGAVRHVSTGAVVLSHEKQVITGPVQGASRPMVRNAESDTAHLTPLVLRFLTAVL